MRRQMRVLAAVATLALVPACSGGSRNGSRPPATAPGPNPDVIPAVITPAYVDAVFKVLNHINGNAARLMAGERELTPAARAELRSIFNDPVYDTELRAASLSIQQGIINNISPTGGDATTTVVQLLTGNRHCIFAATRTDLSRLLRSPTPSPASEYYELSPKQPGADPTKINPTPWAISFNAAFLTATSLPSRCAA